MTSEEIRIAIAEACGWKWTPVGKSTGRVYCTWILSRSEKPDHYAQFHDDEKAGMGLEQLPNYPEDLNAMHEAEKTLTYEQRGDFLHWIRTVVATDKSDVWCFTHLTARQRAEAFLRTLNLWNEPEQKLSGGDTTGKDERQVKARV